MTVSMLNGFRVWKLNGFRVSKLNGLSVWKLNGLIVSKLNGLTVMGEMGFCVGSVGNDGCVGADTMFSVTAGSCNSQPASKKLLFIASFFANRQ